MDAFAALAEPTRRRIVELLASKGTLAAGEIGGHFSVSAAAISQHLGVLRGARLVSVRRDSRRRLYAVNPAGLRAFEEWAKRMAATWEARMDRLDALLAKEMKRAKRK